MSTPNSDNVLRREKIGALIDVARFNPKFTFLIIVLGMVAALLEGIGLSFILPIIEIVETEPSSAQTDRVLNIFMNFYQFVGIPFTLGYVIAGVAAIMLIRYTMSFLVDWLREALRTYYIRNLQIRAFKSALNARVEYFDEEGSDDILNAIVTQTYYAGRVIMRVVQLIEQATLAVVYLSIAIIFAPTLTLIAVMILGGLTILLRKIIEPGYKVGDVVADANERRQEAAQAGTQGIRDVRLFGLGQELIMDFVEAANEYTNARITLRRNEAAINRFYNLGVSVSVFGLIYTALTYADLSLGALGVFLFAMFRLGPKVSNVNQKYYQVENDLPHLVRTQKFIRELETRKETNEATTNVPDEINSIRFDNVSFSYDDEPVLCGVNFEVEKGEFVAFAGQSGAGKSTIVSLIARLYEIDKGEIQANEIPIHDFDINKWRNQISVVRQNPFIFNDTLRYNLTVGNRAVTEDELMEASQIAQINEFIDELPDGFDSMLGDDGIRLSGGQKQRVAIARALLKEADLLILDEATSDLDSNLEQKVQDAIEEMDRDYAMIAIAHRLSTIENADRIYMMCDGQVIESGTHNKLLSEDGHYANLYKIQS